MSNGHQRLILFNRGVCPTTTTAHHRTMVSNGFRLVSFSLSCFVGSHTGASEDLEKQLNKEMLTVIQRGSQAHTHSEREKGSASE